MKLLNIRVLVIFFLFDFPPNAHSIHHAFNCTNSLVCQKEFERFRLEEIKTSILSQLGLAVPPDVLKLPSSKLSEQYGMLAQKLSEEESNDGKETETSFVIATDPSAGEDPSQLIASFDVSDFLDQKTLLKASLSVKLNLPKHETHKKEVTVQIYEKTEDGTLDKMFTTQKVSALGKSRISLAIPTDVVSRFLYSNSQIFGIFVSAQVNGHNVAIHPQQTSDDSENMILQLTFIKTDQRTRRSHTPMCSARKPSEGCCLYDMLVDFEKIEWSWIISPKRFNAYLCRGQCSTNAHHPVLTDTGHTKILKVSHRMGSENKHYFENVGTCCHPIHYDYVQLIYINREGSVAVAKVNGMMATRCGCT